MSYLAVFSLVGLLTLPAMAQLELSVKTADGRPFVTYVDGLPGTDITAAVQSAIDTARRAGGGSIILPPGHYIISSTLHIAGTPALFPKGGAQGIRLSGAGGAQGTTLNYKGPEFSTVIDMPAPWGCTISNLTIDADNTPGIVGIRYRGGYDRQTNGGKNSTFENLILQRMDIGLWIGDPFGPDLVGSSFRAIMINYTRICLLIEGANVTGMAFYNLSVSNWNEAGIKLIGYTARRVRESADDAIPDDEIQGEPAILRDAQTGKELFQKDVAPYALEHRTFTGEYKGQGPYLWAGGGSPDITLYNFNAHGKDPGTWAIDTNWATVRIYTARIEGPAGVLRRTSNAPAGRFADYLVDVNTTSPGNMRQNAIEYPGKGPLYLIGGTFEANIALGDRTVVYDMGMRFYERSNRPTTSAFIKQDVSLEGMDHIKRTGKTTIFPGRRGTYDVVSMQMPRDIGYRPLEPQGSFQIHRMTPTFTRTLAVTANATEVSMTFEGANLQGDDHYQLIATPTFNAGSWWISKKSSNGFTISFTQPAPAGATIDVIVRRPAYDKELR